ncbi:MAG: DUF5606 domain-containing protein [Chitinophagaceae bacterium]|jgi:hypothetical protein
MEYSKIVSVTGLPGLYEVITSKSDGAVVRALDEKVTKFVSSRLHNLSHLESIEVYTTTDNVNLAEIFMSMDKKAGKLPEEKDAKAVKAYFQEVFPDLDFERVYHSDMKKMVRWYSILKAAGVEIKLAELEEEEEVVEETVAVAEETAEEIKPAKKPRAKKESTEGEEAAEKKPAKKK